MTRERGPQPTDSELLRRHVEGDHESFGLLFSRHAGRLWAVALRTLGDTEEAADALQEAMISAFRRAGSFRGDAAVTTWLHRIVVNACLDRVRRQAARPTVAAGDERSLDGLARGGAPAGDPTAERDAALDVNAALGMLPAPQRAALVLVDMMGYPVQAAADMLGVSVGTIKSRCARGRARLAPHLGHLRGHGQVTSAAEVAGTGRPDAAPPGPAAGNRQHPGNVSSARGDNGRIAKHSVDRPRTGPAGQSLEGGGDRV